jgi:hypothetical protein
MGARGDRLVGEPMSGGKQQQPPEGSRDRDQRSTPRPSESSASEPGPIDGQPQAQELPPSEPVPSEELQNLRECPEFWNGVLRAAGSEPRTAREIGGASGVRHGALAVGVDDIEKRLIVISSEGQAYGAALAQADIQSATPDYKYRCPSKCLRRPMATGSFRRTDNGPKRSIPHWMMRIQILLFRLP